jgi:hypothetical protein
MAKSKKRKRQYFCVGGWTNKRDAEIDAKIFKEHGGHKATVKKSGSGYKVCYTQGKKRRGNVPAHLRGSDDRFVVSGPPGWPRSLHASESAALTAGHKCSTKFPNAVCKVTKGLPGMQKTVAECNRNECWKTGGGVGKRRRRRKARR